MQVDGSGHSTSPIDWVDLRRWISGGEKELGVDGSTGREEWHRVQNRACVGFY